PPRPQTAAAPLALPRDDQPLQLALRDLHPHLRRARAPEGPELGGVPPRRRRLPGPRARPAPRDRRAPAEPRSRPDDRPPEGARELDALQLQRDHAGPAAGPAAHRERPG